MRRRGNKRFVKPKTQALLRSLHARLRELRRNLRGKTLVIKWSANSWTSTWVFQARPLDWGGVAFAPLSFVHDSFLDESITNSIRA
jgi:hypothetical protein